ncbi:hypothetical protein [uncultured Desulfobacter sp.]|uniref:hypothetical protein n=1 Tax=uncultured Desulfobacter sp. TaxID=240139 RepID=UPI0029F56745|nr:hypothetical protein [uncultured Desulfobacter sp.]
MSDLKKYVRLVSKLNRLTKEQKITWKKTTPPESLIGTGESVIEFYVTYYSDETIGVGSYRYQTYDGYNDRTYWVTGYYFSLLNDNEQELKYRFPDVAGLDDLLDTIMYETANIGNVVDSLLDAPDDAEED